MVNAEGILKVVTRDSGTVAKLESFIVLIIFCSMGQGAERSSAEDLHNKGD